MTKKVQKKKQKINNKIIKISFCVFFSIIVSIVGIICFQNLQKKKIINNYIGQCINTWIDGKEFCECQAYHLKYMLGEKEAYKYFDMYINISPELSAYTHTKIDANQIHKYCYEKASLTDVFIDKAIIMSKNGLSINKSICALFNHLISLGRQRFIEFANLDFGDMDPKEYISLAQIYELDKFVSSWNNCSDDFVLDDTQKENKDVREVIENLTLYNNRKKQNYNTNKIKEINFFDK